MKRPLLAFACLAAFAPLAAALAGESGRSLHWANGAAFATEYVWRGQSLTDGKPAIVGELKLNHDSGVYAGIWAGNLDLGPETDTSVEIDYFLGWAKRIGQLYVNAGYLYRQRPSDALSLDFEEVSVFASYDFGVARVGAGSYYAWDYFQGGNSTYTYANIGVPLGKPRGVPVSAVVVAGHHDFSNRAIGDYSTVDLRLVARHKAWSYSIGYSDTDIDPGRSGLLTRDQSDARWRVQALVMF
ncbi:hypothetical protein FQY83_08835 [Luteimonas marina]|uniref:Porin n=1 Tax=Luteimonas marina TaxID=488485 RepID=A0A5C5U6C8_9GAMM|nr:TorF family putative porin [Luteimonas marina]TWT21436.1 hypothetical protein FQY83_08835 [Luteimonas marina]